MTDARAGLALWLDRLTLRSNLSDEECAAVLALPGDLALIKPSRDFVSLGERVDRACLVIEGMAGRFGQTRNGDRQITALHVPGDMADLHSVALPTATTALQSIGECVIYRVPHAKIRAVARLYPALAEAFWRDCVVDAAILSEWALGLGQLSAGARVAHLLAELGCRFAIGHCRDGMEFAWPLTQAHIGDATGLTAVHVNRTLRVLREADAADVKPKRVTILNWDRLCSIGGFSPQYLHREKAN